MCYHDYIMDNNETIFILVPRSDKGEQILAESGTNKWKLLRVAEKVYFSDVKGPWLFVSPANYNEVSRLSMWVNKHTDEHFNVQGDIPNEFKNIF